MRWGAWKGAGSFISHFVARSEAQGEELDNLKMMKI